MPYDFSFRLLLHRWNILPIFILDPS
jgi:hypothetical protein